MSWFVEANKLNVGNILSAQHANDFCGVQKSTNLDTTYLKLGKFLSLTRWNLSQNVSWGYVWTPYGSGQTWPPTRAARPTTTEKPHKNNFSIFRQSSIVRLYHQKQLVVVLGNKISKKKKSAKGQLWSATARLCARARHVSNAHDGDGSDDDKNRDVAGLVKRV